MKATVRALQISERLLQDTDRGSGQPNAFGVPAPLLADSFAPDPQERANKLILNDFLD